MPSAFEDPAAFVLYAAGFFDGEGSINICMTTQRATGRSYHRLFVQVSQVDRTPLDLFKARWNGSVMERHNQRAKAGWLKAHHWQSADATAEAFLRDIQPYCIVKARDIEVALRFREIKAVRGSMLGQPRGTPRQEDVWEKREAIRLELLERRSELTAARRAAIQDAVTELA